MGSFCGPVLSTRACQLPSLCNTSNALPARTLVDPFFFEPTHFIPGIRHPSPRFFRRIHFSEHFNPDNADVQELSAPAAQRLLGRTEVTSDDPHGMQLAFKGLTRSKASLKSHSFR